jgi:hypothetical protein
VRYSSQSRLWKYESRISGIRKLSQLPPIPSNYPFEVEHYNVLYGINAVFLIYLGVPDRNVLTAPFVAW